MDFGFLVAQDVFRGDDLASIYDTLDPLSPAPSRGGIRGVLAMPAVRALAEDARLMDLARSFIGETARPLRATLFDKSAASNWLVTWHQDTVLPVKRRVESENWGPWTVKAGQLHAAAPAHVLEQIVAVRIHLDASTSDNGPLRVLPQTHRLGVLSREQIERLVTIIPAVECTTAVGGVVVMRPLTLHASSKTRDTSMRRRVLHIEYAAGTTFGDAELSL